MLFRSRLNILAERSRLVLAGGTDAMSHAPLLFPPEMARWLASWMAAKSVAHRAALALRFRPTFLKPSIAILRGLTDPVVKLSMGSTAEIVAARFGITREQMDAFAVESHRRAAAATKEGRFKSQIVPIVKETKKGPVSFDTDEYVKASTTMETLAKLKPAFKKDGTVTAGNASGINDAGAAIVMMEAKAAKNQKPMARLVAYAHAGVEPQVMGLGPIPAVDRKSTRLNSSHRT